MNKTRRNKRRKRRRVLVPFGRPGYVESDPAFNGHPVVVVGVRDGFVIRNVWR